MPLSLVLLALAGSTVRAAEPAPSPDHAREAVVAALAAGVDIPAQARNLTKLAWPAGKRDEVVAVRARQELVNFSDHAMVALREALNAVKTEYTEEVVATTLAANRGSRPEMAGTHVPILLDALWVGNHGAKVLALRGLQETHSPIAVQPMIDSALEDPSLASTIVPMLGEFKFPQARFYLEKVMMEGPPTLRPAAATALAQIGGAAMGPLKNALKAPSRDTRLLAARAILPAATDYELGAIYEYIEKYGDDDAETTASLKDMAAHIEKAIAARDANAAAGSPKDF